MSTRPFIISIEGNIGAGKTTLARAIITGLGHRGEVPSPTFTIIETYDALPAGTLPQAGDVKVWGVMSVSKTFALAFTLAAPFLVASVIYNVALGAINKAMPQLMVAMVGAPAITAGGLILLAICLPSAIVIWQHRLTSFLSNPFGGW